ncbi:MAG: phosphate/phosphite/phosphonate ABC transporter substrate-binding protein [Thermoproteota archaeon]
MLTSAAVLAIYPPKALYEEIPAVDLNAPLSLRGYQAADREVIYFGFDLRLDVKSELKIYTPLIRYLSQATGREFRIKIYTDYAKLQRALGEGEIQLAAVGPVTYVMVMIKYGNVVPVAVGKGPGGSPYYRAAIVVRPDSQIDSLEDLRGRTLAFGSYYSTQGHLIPRVMLAEAGVSLSELGGYAYLGYHQAVAEAVISGSFDAGALQDQLAERLAAEGLLRIIALSRPYPRSLIVASQQLPPELIDSIREALVKLNPRGEHANLLPWNLTEFPEGFAPVPPGFYDVYFGLVREYLLQGGRG